MDSANLAYIKHNTVEAASDSPAATTLPSCKWLCTRKKNTGSSVEHAVASYLGP